MRPERWKVGELAKRTGLTVRALHHYDAIGLVVPSDRAPSGHRLYTAKDLSRLHQALTLRKLGLSLVEVRDCLDRRGPSPRRTVQLHLAKAREQAKRLGELVGLLEGLDRLLATTEAPSAEQFLQTIEAMTMVENYYTPEQLEQIKKRGEEFGPEAIKAVEQEWPELMAKMKAEMLAGTDPADPKVQALAQRWGELVNAFTGGDPGIRASLDRLWEEQGPNLAAQHGMDFDPRLFEYVGKANAAKT